MSDIPELAFSLDLRGLKAWVEHEDDQPVLHLSDGSQHVTVESVAGGGDARAAAAALAGTVAELGRALDEAGPVEWWTAPEIVTPEQLVKPHDW